MIFIFHLPQDFAAFVIPWKRSLPFPLKEMKAKITMRVPYIPFTSETYRMSSGSCKRNPQSF